MAITAAMVKELREKTGLGMMDCKKALNEANGDMELAIENLRKKGQATAAKRAGKVAKEGTIVSFVEGNKAAMFEVNCETDFVSGSDDFTGFVADLTAALKANIPATLEEVATTPMGDSTVAEVTTELMGKIGEKVTIPSYEVITFESGEMVFPYVHNNGKVGAFVKISSDNNDVLSSDAVKQLGVDLAMQVAASAPQAIDESGLDEAYLAKEKEIFLEQLKNEGKPEAMAEKIVIGKMNKLYKQVTLLNQEFIKADKVSVAKHIEAVAKEVGASLAVTSIYRVELGALDTGSDED